MVMPEAEGRRCLVTELKKNKQYATTLVFKDSDDSPEELSSCWTDLNQAAGQAFSFHHWRRRRQLVSLDQSTGDPGWRRALSGRDDDAHAVVTTPSHGSTPGVYHEADQEPEGERTENKEERRK